MSFCPRFLQLRQLNLVKYASYGNYDAISRTTSSCISNTLSGRRYVKQQQQQCNYHLTVYRPTDSKHSGDDHDPVPGAMHKSKGQGHSQDATASQQDRSGPSEEMMEAVDAVANSLEGDQKQIKSELLGRLKMHSLKEETSTPSTREGGQKQAARATRKSPATRQDARKQPTVTQKVAKRQSDSDSSSSSDSDSDSDSSDDEQAPQESRTAAKPTAGGPKLDISSVLKQHKVDVKSAYTEVLEDMMKDPRFPPAPSDGLRGPSHSRDPPTRGGPRRPAYGEDSYRRDGMRRDQRITEVEDVELYSGPRLDIFDQPSQLDSKQRTEVSNMERLHKEELERQFSIPPANGWIEAIEWTEQGILRPLPANNELGMEEEQQYSFYDHIFLHDQLVDFPKTGPIRHYMELVVAGMAQNPWMTVEEKREHIRWYKQYFDDKKHIMDDLVKSSMEEQHVTAKISDGAAATATTPS